MYVTVYLRHRTPRGESKPIPEGCFYRTKSLTAMHAHIRATYPGSQTYRNPVRVITDLIPGMNLRCRPIVIGGEVVA